MRRVLAASAMALMIGAGWAAPASAGAAETDRIVPADASESVVCQLAFTQDTKVREIPYANSTVLGEIPAGEWADGTWCVPFTTGGKHTTCGTWSNIWVAVDVDDTWGFAHVGCLSDYWSH
ncbi:hypothetical protein [Glycomyces terrestris]|uniref:SH3 domain-containing protein n=1 Tax=Glycomyces terrestris TaxID=2493553 RepID=A0A426UXH0_9ACTN|nr:hypothetical protein [Glycomyces terrestris]RRR99186.1 hypothetical protein EIW28_10625 [Glycomyces terrestris]